MQQYLERAWREEELGQQRQAKERDAAEARQYAKPPSYPGTYEQARVKEFFYNFLLKANNAQIEVFKKVMENPTIEAIRALLNIPYIPQMIREEKQKEAEKLNNMSDRELCLYASERYKTTFYECLLEKHKDNIEREKSKHW